MNSLSFRNFHKPSDIDHLHGKVVVFKKDPRENATDEVAEVRFALIERVWGEGSEPLIVGYSMNVLQSGKENLRVGEVDISSVFSGIVLQQRNKQDQIVARTEKTRSFYDSFNYYSDRAPSYLKEWERVCIRQPSVDELQSLSYLTEAKKVILPYEDWRNSARSRLQVQMAIGIQLRDLREGPVGDKASKYIAPSPQSIATTMSGEIPEKLIRRIDSPFPPKG